VRSLATLYGCTVQEIEDALDELKKGYPLYGATVTPGGLMVKEYAALTEEIPDLSDREDFVPLHHTDDWKKQAHGADGREKQVIAAVEQLIGVNRLREVRIFNGFSRVHQTTSDGIRPIAESEGQEKKAGFIEPDLGQGLDWLPAIELYGEGIFFTLSASMLKRWEAQAELVTRAHILERRFESTGMYFPDAPTLPLPPRFVLLHTLAHLLIRQLETKAGYPAASIRERIYCSEEGEKTMAGILVYVAEADVFGSLGGLAELAEPARFLPLLSDVFAHAEWCSLDPVCGEHEGQGPNQLNLAACHACALVPEPSCQFNNALLDRVFVRGDLVGTVRPLLDFVIDED
jgi:hypothetical protein